MASTDNDAAIRDLRFKTSFVRDDRFRFEFRQYHPHLGKSGPDIVSVVWSNGTRHTFYSSPIGQKDYGSLIGPVSATTGISAASIIHIPSLLMPENIAISPTWLSLEGARISTEEIVDNRKCFVLGGFRRITDYSIWIDKDDYSIRKIVHVMRMTQSQSEEMQRDLQRMKDEGKLPPEMPIPNFDLKDMSTTYNYSNIEFDKFIDSADLEPNFPTE
ncbi:MAG: hypothetical protein KIT34_14780 [Cyanobacteria bacterium TGS_CYA1]|nr:hypothetical protein [Cyanobacteria bacterium TGS_CYA1]